MAHYRLNGRNAATYESCSTAAFKHGRTETVRPCTTTTAAICEAFEHSNDANVETMLGLLQETSGVHGELTKNAAMGTFFPIFQMSNLLSTADFVYFYTIQFFLRFCVLKFLCKVRLSMEYFGKDELCLLPCKLLFI